MQRVQAAEPPLAERPLVLQTRDSRRGLIVAAANLAARAAGVRAHMSLSEASALTPLEIRTHDPNEDLDQLCHLTELAQQFSPIVGLEQLDKKPWAGRNSTSTRMHFARRNRPRQSLWRRRAIAWLGQPMVVRSTLLWLHGDREQLRRRLGTCEPWQS